MAVARKRKRELEDHLNLVRAIRTRKTLDLAAHLSARQDGDQSESESVSSHASGERRSWSRWPLLKGDVHVPEWSLSDEVEEMVARFLKADRDAADAVPETEQATPMAVDTQERDVDLATSVPADEVSSPEDDNASDASSAPPFPPAALRDITESTHVYLTRLLRTVALARPPVHSILTRRLKPLDWVSVLELAGAHGLADIETIQYVREVMEDIHGPANLKVLERMRTLEARRDELRAFAASHDDVDDEPPIPRRRAADENIRSDMDEENDADDLDAEDRPVRSREFISDSDVSGVTDGQPKRRLSRELVEDSDAPMPDVQAIPYFQTRPTLARRTSARFSSAASNIAASSRSRKPSRRSTARTADEARSRASTPGPSGAVGSDDEDSNWEDDDPLSAGWRVSAFNSDEDFRAPRKARSLSRGPKKGHKPAPMRRAPSRARSKSTGL